MPSSRAASNQVVEVDEITLDGRKVRVRNVDLPLDSVRLDPANPRIANTVASGLEGEGANLQRRLEALLWEDDDVRDLYRQILINRGLVERIIVSEDGKAIEGNCRTVCFRKLREKYPKEHRWRTIPARVLPPDIGEREVAILLGEMHVAGKNTWTPFEKAGHVYRLHRDFALTQDEIAQRLRMSKSKVNQLVRAFDTMKNKFLPRYPGHASIRKFSYFEELYKSPRLRDWVASTSGAEDMFVDWVGRNRLSQGMHVRELATILGSPEAVEALTAEGFGAAEKIVSEDNPAAASKLFRRMAEMTDALKKAQLDDIRHARDGGNAHARKIVLEMSKAFAHFLELCELKGEQ